MKQRPATLIARMALWKVALLAFLAMAVQDVLSTAMVVYESRLNAPVSGGFDVAGWIFSLICMGLALDSILKNGWRNPRSLIIIAAVSLANFTGTYLGIYIAKALTGGHV